MSHIMSSSSDDWMFLGVPSINPEMDHKNNNNNAPTAVMPAIKSTTLPYLENSSEEFEEIDLGILFDFDNDNIEGNISGMDNIGGGYPVHYLPVDNDDKVVDTVCAADNNCNENDSAVAVTSKHPVGHFYTRLIRRLRLFKAVSHDIRHDYASMIVNVFNSHDFPMLESFLRTICGNRTNSRLILQQMQADGSSGPKISFTGIQYGIAYWSSLLQLFPDYVLQLSNVEVFDRPNQSGSIIKLRTKSTATKSYDLRAVDLAVHYVQGANVHACSHGYITKDSTMTMERIRKRLKLNDSRAIDGKIAANNSSAHPVNETVCIAGGVMCFPPTEPFQYYLATKGCLPPTLATPVQDIVEGEGIIYLNANKLIVGLEVRAMQSHQQGMLHE